MSLARYVIDTVKIEKESCYNFICVFVCNIMYVYFLKSYSHFCNIILFSLSFYSDIFEHLQTSSWGRFLKVVF